MDDLSSFDRSLNKINSHVSDIFKNDLSKFLFKQSKYIQKSSEFNVKIFDLDFPISIVSEILAAIQAAQHASSTWLQHLQITNLPANKLFTDSNINFY
jgi:hypothetical protein